MTSQYPAGSSTPQLDAYLYGIRKEFDRLNNELDEARKQRDEYQTNYRNQEKELQELIKNLLHRLNGKDQICERCKGDIAHTTGPPDENPSMSPTPSSEYYSPLEEIGVVRDRLDDSIENIQVEEERNEDVDVGEGTISVENEDPVTISRIRKSGWDIKYNVDTETALKLDLVHELTQECTRVAFSPDGKYLATTSTGGVVCIFDVNRGERISVMRDLYKNPDELCYTRLCFSPDGNYLATGEDDGTVSIWIISQRRVRNIFRLVYIRDLHFSPNGQHLVTCTYLNTVRIWRLRDGFSRVLPGGLYRPWAVRFSPDGRYVASGNNPWQIVIWNVRTGRLVARWKGHSEHVFSLVFTPDGKGLLSASVDTAVVCWDVAWLSSLGITMDAAEGEQDVKSTVTEISRFAGHTNSVYTVSVSPDGRWIASGSEDRTVRIWNAHDATLQCILHGPDVVWSVSFSPDGTYLAMGGSGQQATIWECSHV